MAETLGEWRRAGSTCDGALLWWLNDVLPGAGWGLLDNHGRPKPAYWIARRALAPVAVWTTDEGLNGVAVHVANDTGADIDAVVDVRLLRDGEQVIGEAQRALRLPRRTTIVDDVEAILGHFADAAYAYRFGPPQHDVVAVTLLAGDEVISQSVRFPLGRQRPAHEAGLTAVARLDPDGVHVLELGTRRVAQDVRIDAPGFEPDDDWLLLVPGFRRIVHLRPAAWTDDRERPNPRIHAPNRGGSVPVVFEQN
jgi:beta-mannosidase